MSEIALPFPLHMTCNDQHCECHEEAFEPEEEYFDDEIPDEYSSKQIVGITVDQKRLAFELPAKVEYHITQVALGLQNSSKNRHVVALSFGENPEETYVIARLIPGVMEAVTIDVTVPASIVSQEIRFIVDGEECGPIDILGTLTYIKSTQDELNEIDALRQQEYANQESSSEEDVDHAVKTLQQQRDELMQQKQQIKSEKVTVEPAQKVVIEDKPKQADKQQPQQQAQRGDSKQFREFKGIQIRDDKIGTGRECKRGNRVVVTYILRLGNEKGQILDQTKGNQKFQFRLGQGEVISGWDLGVPNMKVGGKRTLIVPPARGYGSKQMGSVPANSTLYFEIELHDVK